MVSRAERIEAALREALDLTDRCIPVVLGRVRTAGAKNVAALNLLRQDLIEFTAQHGEARAALALPEEAVVVPTLKNGDFALALDVTNHRCHEAADAFWAYWNANGETHKRGYYESTWGAINRALRLVGTHVHFYGEDHPPVAAQSAPVAADDVLEALDLDPESFRTEGGAINRGKLRAAILHPYNYLPPDHWMQARFSKPGGRPKAPVEQASLAANAAPGAESVSAPVAAAEAPDQWSNIVEDRLNSWRRRIMNNDGDRLALDDFMDRDAIDDLIDFVCAPIAQTSGGT